MLKSLTFIAASAAATVAFAQEIGPALDPTVMVGWAGGAAAQQQLEMKAGARPVAVGNTFDKPAPAKAEALTYTQSAQAQKQAETAYLQRLQTSNPKLGEALATELKKNDFDKVYAGIVTPYGLKTNDTADVLTAYTLLGYLIANGAPDPSAKAVSSARNQIAARLSNEPTFKDEANRAALGEELKITFVTLHAGWQSAKKDGTLKAYSDGVSDLFAKNGVNLRAMHLTSAGFAK